jgi:hypothetical protein
VEKGCTNADMYVDSRGQLFSEHTTQFFKKKTNFIGSHLIFVFDRTKTSTGLNHDPGNLNSKVKLFSERTVHNFSKKN